MQGYEKVRSGMEIVGDSSVYLKSCKIPNGKIQYLFLLVKTTCLKLFMLEAAAQKSVTYYGISL